MSPLLCSRAAPAAARSTLRRHLLIAAAAVFSGCASRPASRPEGVWTGRLSLQVKTEPMQSFSASFELDGNARQGQLQRNPPLGHALAQARWTPTEAVLVSGGQTRRYTHIEELLLAATGTALPLGALFDWLGGQATPVPGWLPDLSRLAEGRLQARRSEPGPAVDLRILLDR